MHARLRIVPLGIALALISACATVPPEEDPVWIRMNEIDARLKRIEAVVQNQSLLQLAQRIDGLQADLRALRGSIEELQNSEASLRKQQRDLYADLDRRLASAQSATSAGATGGGAEGEQAAYTRAFDALKASNYTAAISGFNQFLVDHPRSDLASNAAYWLGEAHYVTRDYPNAAAAFERVTRDWPASQKAPDALLKLGYTQLELKRTSAARGTLALVVSRYPGTEAAKLASERLRTLGPGA